MIGIERKNGKRRVEEGFTILEALVTAFLLVIVAALAMPSFLDFVRDHKFKGAAGSISSDLRLTQSLAVSRGQRYRLLFSGNALGGSPAITYQMQVDTGTPAVPNWQLAAGVFPNNQRNIAQDYPGIRVDGRAGAPSAQVVGATIDRAQTFPSSAATFNVRGLAEGIGTAYLMNEQGDMLAVTLSPTGNVSILRYSSRDTAGNWSVL